MSLWAFRKKLSLLGHFPSVYRDIGNLKYQFDQQLEKLVESGFIELATRETKPDAAPQPAMPYLAYGSWTLRDAIRGRHGTQLE